jgi:hypothetical protein
MDNFKIAYISYNTKFIDKVFTHSLPLIKIAHIIRSRPRTDSGFLSSAFIVLRQLIGHVRSLRFLVTSVLELVNVLSKNTERRIKL